MKFYTTVATGSGGTIGFIAGVCGCWQEDWGLKWHWLQINMVHLSRQLC
jgi:hypothetical protein